MDYQMFCSIRNGRRFQGLTSIRDVVHDDDAVRPTVEWSGDVSEAFLTRGIPLKHKVLSVKVRQALQGQPRACASRTQTRARQCQSSESPLLRPPAAKT